MPEEKGLDLNCTTGKKTYFERTEAELAQQVLDDAVEAGLQAKEKLQKRETVVELRSKKTDAAKLGPEYAELVTDLQSRIDALESELNG